MNLLKKTGAIVLAVVILVGLAVVLSPSARAISTVDGDIEMVTYISNDGGKTWHSSNEPTCVKPGDEVQIKTKVWNESSEMVNSVYGTSGTLQGAPYFNDCTNSNPNEDGDDFAFTHGFFTDDHETHINSVAPNGSESDGYQSSITTCRIPMDPPCDTPIQGYIQLTRFDNSTDGTSGDQRPLTFVGKALAAVNLSDRNEFTITVNREDCPERCPGSSTITTTASSVTSLPETGSSIMALIDNII